MVWVRQPVARQVRLAVLELVRWTAVNLSVHNAVSEGKVNTAALAATSARRAWWQLF